MFRKIGLTSLAALGLSSVSTSSFADDIWVEVTKPMLACQTMGGPDNPGLAEVVLDLLIHPPADGVYPSGCGDLEVGHKLKLEDAAYSQNSDYIVTMLSPVCHGCVPFMEFVYAPPRRIVGAYLRPTSPPDGW